MTIFGAAWRTFLAVRVSRGSRIPGRPHRVAISLSPRGEGRGEGVRGSGDAPANRHRSSANVVAPAAAFLRLERPGVGFREKNATSNSLDSDRALFGSQPARPRRAPSRPQMPYRRGEPIKIMSASRRFSAPLPRRKSKWSWKDSPQKPPPAGIETQTVALVKSKAAGPLTKPAHAHARRRLSFLAQLADVADPKPRPNARLPAR